MSYAKTYMKLKNSKDRRLEVIEGARHVSWSTHCREYCGAYVRIVGTLADRTRRCGSVRR